MPSLSERIRFAETYVRNKEGVDWSLKGRPWVRDEFWKAATGYKLWRPRDGSKVCTECTARAGSVIEHPLDNDTRTKEHRSEEGCPGLEVYPILFVGLNLKRQDGKTFNTMAFALAEMGLNRNISIALTAASEDQVRSLFEENYKQAIDTNKKLAKHFRVVGLKIYADKTNGLLEALATSHKSATGRTRRYVLIDEAKDVSDKVADSVIHHIEAMSGIQCPFGHVSRIDAAAADEALNAPTYDECGTCGSRLEPFFGRIIATSSSGVIEDDGRSQWFAQLVSAQLGIGKNDFGEELPPPSPYAHVFASDAPLNPAKSEVMQDGIRAVFGGLPAMRDLTQAAMGSKWMRKGEDFVTPAEVSRCVDRRLENADECSAPCVGFVDTSDTGDKTSIVILAHDEASIKPWERVYTPLIEFWDPAKLKNHVINEDDVQKRIEEILPLYTGLRALHIDVRGRPWAQSMVKNLKNSKVKPWTASTAHETDAGWEILQKRIRAMTIRLLEVAEMGKEFRGLNAQRRDGKPLKVTDRNRRASHKDITESLALCCYLVAIEAAKKQSGWVASPLAKPGPTRSLIASPKSKLFGRLDGDSW